MQLLASTSKLDKAQEINPTAKLLAMQSYIAMINYPKEDLCRHEAKEKAERAQEFIKMVVNKKE